MVSSTVIMYRMPGIFFSKFCAEGAVTIFAPKMASKSTMTGLNRVAFMPGIFFGKTLVLQVV